MAPSREMVRKANGQLESRIPGQARVLPHLSASQVKTWRQCHRKWALEKLWFERSPQTVAQATGTAIHACAEEYLKGDGSWNSPEKHDPAHIAIILQAANAGNLPSPGPDLLIEQEIRLPLGDGLPDMLGYIDLVNPRTPWSDEFGNLLILDDHKSTSDFKYALTEEELRGDVQMVTYAMWGYQPQTGLFLAEHTGHPRWNAGVDLVEVSHIYQHKKKRASRRVAARTEYGRVAREWTGIVDDAREMVTCAAAPPVNPLEIPGNSNACDAYGGCPHRTTCGVGKTLFNIRLGAERRNMERRTESLKERIARKKAEQAAAGATAATDTTTTTPADPLAIRASAMMATGLTPPDAPPRVNPTAPTEGADVAEATAEPTYVLAGAPAPAEVPDLRKRRGRPPGSKNAPKAPALPAPPEPPEPLVSAVRELQLEPKAPEAIQALGSLFGGPVLMVDCVATGGLHMTVAPLRRPVSLETWLRPIADAVADEFGVAHVGLIEYGKGKAALAAGIKIAIEAGQLPDVVAVDTRIPGSDVFLEIASSKAALIIKGW